MKDVVEPNQAKAAEWEIKFENFEHTPCLNFPFPTPLPYFLNRKFHSLQMGQSIQEWTKSNILKGVFHKFYLVHSWILRPKCSILTPGF